MKNLQSIDKFMKTDYNDQSSFFENNLSYDDIDYHGRIAGIRKDVEREQKKFVILSKIDQMNDLLQTLKIVIADLDSVGVNTKSMQDVYYRLSSVLKSLI
jgi:hypothetical protein